MAFQVRVENTGEVFRCEPGTPVLQAMEQLRCRGIPAGCRNGGCGVCKVRVVQGAYVTTKMSRAVLSEDEQARGHALACRTYPRGDLRLEVVGKMVRSLGPARGAAFSHDFAAMRQTEF